MRCTTALIVIVVFCCGCGVETQPLKSPIDTSNETRQLTPKELAAKHRADASWMQEVPDEEQMFTFELQDIIETRIQVLPEI